MGDSLGPMTTLAEHRPEHPEEREEEGEGERGGGEGGQDHRREAPDTGVISNTSGEN